MSELRRIKALPIAGLKPAAFDGVLPELIWVAPTDLVVDATYQRDLSDRSIRLIRKLVEGFSWNRFKPPIVVKAGPASLHIVDGQHTAIVAATIGIPQIPIFVVHAATVDERARAFVGHNSDRVIVSPFDIYHALLAAGDPDAVDVANVCKRAGIRVRVISPSSAIAEGDTAAVGIVRALVKRRGVVRSRKALQALVPARRAPISAAEIAASESIVCVDRPKIEVEQLAAAIRIDGIEGLRKAQTKAKSDREPVWKVLRDRWLRLLDRGDA